MGRAGRRQSHPAELIPFWNTAGMPSAADPLPGPGLAAFVAAVETGTVHGAAEALELTQSAATKRIQALERRTGVPLFERGPGGLRLTEAGRVLYPEARQALAALRHAADALDTHRAGIGRELRITSSQTIGEVLLPGWLTRFREADESVRPLVDVVNSPAVLQALREHRAEIGFVEGVDRLDGFERRLLRRDEIVVVVTPDHPWAGRTTVRPHELRRHGYVAREAGSGVRAVASAALERAGVALVPALEMASTSGAKHALDRRSFALLSNLVVAAEQEAGTLRGITIEGVDLSRELRAVRLARGPRSAAGAEFWRWLGSARRRGDGVVS